MIDRPDETVEPSLRTMRTRSFGSTRRKTSAAVLVPATTACSRATIFAIARALVVTKNSLVMSPAPQCSSSAIAIGSNNWVRVVIRSVSTPDKRIGRGRKLQQLPQHQRGRHTGPKGPREIIPLTGRRFAGTEEGRSDRRRSHQLLFRDRVFRSYCLCSAREHRPLSPGKRLRPDAVPANAARKPPLLFGHRPLRA